MLSELLLILCTAYHPVFRLQLQEHKRGQRNANLRKIEWRQSCLGQASPQHFTPSGIAFGTIPWVRFSTVVEQKLWEGLSQHWWLWQWRRQSWPSPPIYQSCKRNVRMMSPSTQPPWMMSVRMLFLCNLFWSLQHACMAVPWPIRGTTLGAATNIACNASIVSPGLWYSGEWHPTWERILLSSIPSFSIKKLETH